MSAEAEIQGFFEAYIQSRGGKITQQTDDAVTVAYPDGSSQEFTYQPSVAREKKILLLTAGSPAFQQILKESLENGVLCQISLSPKDSFETLIAGYFRDSPHACVDCPKAAVIQDGVRFCMQAEPCFHQIHNGKIVSIKVAKRESARFFQFYYSVSFQNKLRLRSEEIIPVLLDEKGNCVNGDPFDEVVLRNEAIGVQDSKSKLKPEFYDELKAAADQKLDVLLKEKVALFDLPLGKERRAKLRSFERRLRRERRERVISKKHDFDFQKWQADYEALLAREEEAYQTSIAIKLLNLLVINTSKVKFEAALDNKAVIQSTVTIGVDNPEVTCPLCKKTHTEGCATEDGFYVCGDCVRQSVDSGKIYSKKAPLILDETLNEYFERDKGFVCSVCGKRHSRLLEFKCSHDNTSVCIYHYDVCDVCGKPFSKLNLTHTDEFRKKLCPKHAKKEP